MDDEPARPADDGQPEPSADEGYSPPDAPEDASAPEEGAPQGKDSLLRRLLRDMGAARKTVALRMAIRKLKGQLDRQREQLGETLLALGTKADEDDAAQAIADDESAPAAPEARRLREAADTVARTRPVLDEKTEALNEAKRHLDEEEKKHGAAIDALEKQVRQREKEAKAKDDDVKAIEKRIRAHENEIRDAQAKIQKAEGDPESKVDVQALRNRVAELESALAEDRPKIGPAQTEAALAREAANTKAAEVKTAKANWKTLRSKLTDILDNARREHEQATETYQAAENDRQTARAELGRKLFESQTAPEACAQIANQARATTEAIEATEADIAARRDQIEQLRSGARRFTFTAVGCLLALLLVVVALAYGVPQLLPRGDDAPAEAAPGTAAPAAPATADAPGTGA